jgi:myo-inositol-hexaphosphate 3-phosphohydrolase
MKTYNISAETNTRILKNWIIEAKNKDDAVNAFRTKANIGVSKITKLKVVEQVKESSSNKKTMYNVMKVVDEWLKSEDTFVTDKDGLIIKDGLIDCKKGSLLTRIIKAFGDVA